ncbi:MAG TPA: arsenate reductase (glutaredoxin) [Acidimicrobiales bacterium]|nr:arsenate reductase (glutaredoxin) [Acidimicrobiales bacterium]
MDNEAQLYYNPACSKCRTADGLLKERGIDAEQVRYLDRAPTLDELRDLMTKLGIDDPRAMVRTGEAIYAELGLATATADRLLEAITEHPILLERPIFVRDDKAVIARPPERLLDLL